MNTDKHGMEHKALADATAELWAWAEIDEEPEADAGCRQIINQLCLVYRHQGAYGLDLDEKNVGNHEVGAKLTNHMSPIAHHHRLLALDQEPALFQLDREGVFINGFKKSMAQFLVGFVERADHAFRSEEHTSELQPLMRISYAVFCL